MQIVGVSFDAPTKNQAWAEEEGFRFDLWSDDARTLALTYGAASDGSQGSASRITVLLDPLGDLALVYADGIDVGTHPDEVLHDCQVLWGGG